MYVCSCVDHAVHYTVCKHTHLVHLQRTENSDKELLCMLNELDNNREVPDNGPEQWELQTMDEEVSTASNETEENSVREEKKGISMRSNECAEMKDGLIHVNEVPKEIEGNFNQDSDSHDGGVPNRVNLQYYSE